jgi:predicted negative regulator of RcsB-dependent stress response
MLQGGVKMISEVREYINANKKNIIIICVLLIVIVVAWDVFGSKLSNTGSGADTARQQLNTVINQQSESINTIKTVETGLGNSIKSVGTIESTVDHATVTNSNSIATATDSASIIADCQRILKSVRERDKSKN